MYIAKTKKVIINSSDGSLTRLANKYRDLNSKLKNLKESRSDALELLRDRVLSEFDPMDSDKTRIVKTNSLRISVNKDTIRKPSKQTWKRYLKIYAKYIKCQEMTWMPSLNLTQKKLRHLLNLQLR